MPDRLTNSSDSAAVVRQLKILVVLLIISNIILGVMGFVLLRAIDRNYSVLIEQSVPVLSGLHTLTTSASDAMRSTNPALLTEGKHSPAELGNATRDAIARDAAARTNVLKRDWIGQAASERGTIEQTGEIFDRTATKFIGLLETNNTEELGRQREAELRPVYNQYVAAMTRAASLLHSNSLKTSDTLSLRSSGFSRLLLSVGSWPMVILAGFLMFTAVFVIVVLVRVKLFRHETA